MEGRSRRLRGGDVGGSRAKAGADGQAPGADQDKVDAGHKKALPSEKASDDQQQPGASAKGTSPLPADLPQDFGSESVLRTWIGLFNNSILNMKEPQKKKWLDKLKKKG